jgi:hypothetical protein
LAIECNRGIKSGVARTRYLIRNCGRGGAHLVPGGGAIRGNCTGDAAPSVDVTDQTNSGLSLPRAHSFQLNLEWSSDDSVQQSYEALGRHLEQGNAGRGQGSSTGFLIFGSYLRL